jgi:hypothetical protein
MKKDHRRNVFQWYQILLLNLVLLLILAPQGSHFPKESIVSDTSEFWKYALQQQSQNQLQLVKST